MIKQNMTPFIHTLKQEQLLMKVTFLEKGSGWIIDSVIDPNINISKYNPLSGSRYIKLPKQLDHPTKDLINIQNIDDNECFKWFLYLHPADHHLARIT